jgi:hypothetical protein
MTLAKEVHQSKFVKALQVVELSSSKKVYVLKHVFISLRVISNLAA